jgi:hypothetical protein
MVGDKAICPSCKSEIARLQVINVPLEMGSAHMSGAP